MEEKVGAEDRMSLEGHREMTYNLVRQMERKAVFLLKHYLSLYKHAWHQRKFEFQSHLGCTSESRCACGSSSVDP